MNQILTDSERQRAFKFCTDNLDGCWNKLQLNDIEIRKVSGGMSNLLYHCALKERIKIQESEPKEVLLRVYGPSHGDTQVQLEIFNRLASENLGPKLYGSFNDGRLEEYLPSSALSWSELTNSSISATIAKKIAAIHRLEVECLDKNSHWLIDNYNQCNDFITKISEKNSLKMVMIKPNIRESTKQIAMQLLETEDFKPEIDFLDELFRDSKSPMVFSHNDLHQNNIILLNQHKLSNSISDDIDNNNLQDRVVLIDYEYCSYNYRAFDLANHLMEWCFDYNNNDQYPYFTASFERFPTRAQQKQFVAHYLSSSNNKSDTSDHTERFCDINNHSNGHTEASSNGNHSGNANNGQEIDDVEMLYQEMQPFLMASNFLWALWAMKSACTSEIDFGYWEMAKWKWDLYMFCKERYLNKSNNMQ